MDETIRLEWRKASELAEHPQNWRSIPTNDIIGVCQLHSVLASVDQFQSHWKNGFGLKY